MTRLGRTLAILAVAVLPAGCGELPHPFRHSGLGPALARPRDARAVAVIPPYGAGGNGLGPALVTALAHRQIPAELGPGLPGGDRLVTRISASGATVTIDWMLSGPQGRTRRGDRVAIPAAVWRTARPDQLAALAERAVASLFPRNPPTAQPSPTPAPPSRRRPTARILPLARLPGDGATALARALGRDLAADGITMVTSGGDYLVQGRASVVYDRSGNEILALAWVVADAKGHALGTVRQGGPLPAGGLPHRWGKLADAIAAGGAEGILRVITATRDTPPAPLQGR